MTPQTPAMPSRRGLLLRLLISAVVGTLLVVCVILPAEYRKDPTGFGRMTGLLALTTPVVQTPAEPTDAPPADAAVSRLYEGSFRTDTIKIPIGPDGELEYKATMRAGQTMIYTWEVDRGSVYYDFHGEPADPKQSQSYLEVQEATRASGAFVAPFDGKHGWFWLNLTGEPLVITLKLTGFYESHDYVR